MNGHAIRLPFGFGQFCGACKFRGRLSDGAAAHLQLFPLSPGQRSDRRRSHRRAFEKAWRHRERYREDLASFSTWLFIIARRIAADHFRRRRPTVPLEEAARLANPQSLEEEAQERAEFAQLSAVLARLAERERELVALKYGAGLTNRAIARISGLSESNVSTILHRLTRQLRAQLENYHE